MEDKNENSLNREATNSKVKLPKPPTRLQKRAPAGLQLDQIPSAGNTPYPLPSPGDEINASVGCAIPLLSPLVLSPVPSLEGEEAELVEEEKKRFMGSEELGGRGISHSSNNDNNTIATPPPPPQGNPGGGWRHPAADAFPDPSSVFSFFQSQCALVNRVQ